MSILEQTRIQDDLALLEESLEAARASLLGRLPSDSTEHQALAGAIRAFASLQESQKQGAFQGKSFDSQVFLRKLWPVFFAAAAMKCGARVSVCQFGQGEIPKELTQPSMAVLLAWAKALQELGGEGRGASSMTQMVRIEAMDKEVSLFLSLGMKENLPENFASHAIRRIRELVAENGGWMEVRGGGGKSQVLNIKLVRPSLRARFFTLRSSDEMVLLPQQLCRMVPQGESPPAQALLVRFLGKEEGFTFLLNHELQSSSSFLELRLADRILWFASDLGFEDVLARVISARSFVAKGSWFQNLGVVVDEKGATRCIPVAEMKNLLSRMESKGASS